MKSTRIIVTIITLGLFIIVTSCSKVDKYDTSEEDFKIEEADLEFMGDGVLKKVITSPLVKLEDCKYIVAGTIEFHKGDNIVATIDFGDGTCDNVATKIVGDELTEFKLDKKGKDGMKDYYDKVIIEPIVKTDECEYIVSGIVDFYKGDTWIATIDFGDGTCDEWATKTWDGGSKQFSLRK